MIRTRAAEGFGSFTALRRWTQPGKGPDMSGNIAKRSNGRWRARYRDVTGNEHSRHFARKIDAQHWLDEVTAAVVAGTYADPKAGRITFAAFFGEWSARQVWAPGTVLRCRWLQNRCRSPARR